MSAVTFDTLGAARRLMANGFSKEQAEGLAQEQLRALESFEQSRELATKADVAQLRAEMDGIKADLLKWMVGLSFAFGAFLVAVFAWLK